MSCDVFRRSASPPRSGRYWLPEDKRPCGTPIFPDVFNINFTRCSTWGSCTRRAIFSNRMSCLIASKYWIDRRQSPCSSAEGCSAVLPQGRDAVIVLVENRMSSGKNPPQILLQEPTSAFLAPRGHGCSVSEWCGSSRPPWVSPQYDSLAVTRIRNTATGKIPVLFVMLLRFNRLPIF